MKTLEKRKEFTKLSTQSIDNHTRFGINIFNLSNWNDKRMNKFSDFTSRIANFLNTDNEIIIRMYAHFGINENNYRNEDLIYPSINEVLQWANLLEKQ